VTQTTQHGCALELEGKGVLILGPSGSGKTSTLLETLDHAHKTGRSAHLLADDRVLLEARGKDLIARAPPTLRGLVEVYGFGIVEHAYLMEAPIRLVCNMVSRVERMRESERIELEGISLPLVKLPAGQEIRARRILIQALESRLT